ncbi:MAG: betaine/proline/choline family ABC transporter ATP-binding protein [Bacillota bacterium]
MVVYEDVTKIYDDNTVAVDGLDLTVEHGEFMVFIGPSGCGKTTTLQMTNRLKEPTSGRILLNGKDTRQMRAVDLRRNMGYVIQEIALFPHMTVAQNISVVPDLLGWSKKDKRDRARELLEMVALDPDIYMDRYPRELSGGQQQRIGVLRALAVDPEVLLMDEPFGGLDPITRDQLHEELKSLQDKVHKTIIFVTHDMDEALKLADRVTLMRDGKIVQVDTPEEILRNPNDEFVADFIGSERRLISPLDVLVREVMLRDVPTLSLDAGLDEALGTMQEENTDYVAVVDGEEFLGMLSAHRLQRVRLSDDFEKGKVSDTDLITVTVDSRETMMTAVHRMAESQEHALGVVNSRGKLVGAISRGWLPEILAKELWPIEAAGYEEEES